MIPYNEENYKYQSNYAWPGVTTILYNLNKYEYSNALSTSDPVYTEDNVIEMGVGYKEAGDSNVFIKIPVFNLEQDIWSWKETATEVGNNGVLLGSAGSHEPFGEKDVWGDYLFPYLVAIQKLTPNTKYEICGYATVSGENGLDDILFAPQQITTLPQGGSISWEEGTGWSTLTEQIKNNAKDAIDHVVAILNEMCTHTYDVTINISTDLYGGGAVNLGDKINVSPAFFTTSNLWKLKSTIMHEIGHSLFKYVGGHTDKETQFMEWATGLPNTKWMWLYPHNYPIIPSGENNSIRDLYKRAAAYQVSTELSNPAPTFYLKFGDTIRYGTQHGNTYDFGTLPRIWSRVDSNIPWSNDTTGWSGVSQYNSDSTGTTYDISSQSNNINTWSVNGYNFIVRR